MAYTTNIPQASDKISTSQAQILANFQFLGDTTGNAIPGYYIFPNGLKMQWGNQGPTGWSGSGSNRLSPAQTFPIAFTSAVYNIVITPRIDDVDSSKTFVVDNLNAPTVTEFYIRANNVLFSTIYWYVIGV